jgi:hypothetical protein
MKKILDRPRMEYIKKNDCLIEGMFNIAGSIDVDVLFNWDDQYDNHKSLPAFVSCQTNITIIINILKHVPPK